MTRPLLRAVLAAAGLVATALSLPAQAQEGQSPWQVRVRALAVGVPAYAARKKRIDEVLAKAKAGGDFAALAKDFSDEPGAGARGGDVAGAVVRLLDIGHLRVGNEAYAEANKSYGATTLRKRHGSVRGNTLKLRYKGKSGKERDVAITDKRLAATVRKMLADFFLSALERPFERQAA